ncbi:MAG: two-component sensor histidine kinase [Mesorhizobium amorphae]|nr:MAG: two-component sensor histidine kinase [Mesorhizobium amorphae]
MEENRQAIAWGLFGVAVGLILAAPLQGMALWAAVACLGAGGLALLLRAPDPAAPVSLYPAPSLDARAAPVDGVGGADLAAILPDPLLIFDRRGYLLHANPAARTAFGVLRPGLALPLRFRSPEMQALIGGLLDGSIAEGEAELSERVPLERLLQVRGARLGEGMFALSFRDLGEARRIDRMRADFVANASHELRTPLASISGFVETLRGPARDDARAREKFLGIIGEQTARMARLIDDLLSLSRLESRPHLDLRKPVDLAEIARQAAEAQGPLAAEVQVVIEKAIAAEPVLVGGSRDELFQVAENLLENACRYGAEGGRVRITAQRLPDGSAELAVRDWGQGIASEHLPRITERFYRADVASSRAKKGTGLGLSIVKHIATRHKARLLIESRPGEGATFSIRFPGHQG